MNRNTLIALLAIVLVANISPGFTADGVALPLPPAAKEVRNMKPEGAWHQTNYVVEAKYPDDSMAEFYLSNVKAPWLRCFVGVPEWQSFGDVSNGNNRFVHQKLMHWVNRKEQKLLMVGMHYYSTGYKPRRDPDSTTQHVVVAEYPEQDIDQAIELLKLKCEK